MRGIFSIMKKQAIFILVLITLFFTSAYIMANYGTQAEEEAKTNISETESRNKIENENVISVNAEEERTTPNTKFVLKKYYADCRTLGNGRGENS